MVMRVNRRGFLALLGGAVASPVLAKLPVPELPASPPLDTLMADWKAAIDEMMGLPEDMYLVVSPSWKDVLTSAVDFGMGVSRTAIVQGELGQWGGMRIIESKQIPVGEVFYATDEVDEADIGRFLTWRGTDEVEDDDDEGR